MTDSMGSEAIGLALSGGGVRASVFHLGVLRALAARNRLEDVSQISTVSGGSLIVAAIFSHSGMDWPSSREYLENVYPTLRKKLTEGDLFSAPALGLSGLIAKFIAVLFDRAGLLSDLLCEKWGVVGSLRDLPDVPAWYINATSLETGKNWRFSKEMMGDWQFGRLFAPDVPISRAVAASAAVPYVIGSLRLSLPEHGWWEVDPETREPLRKKTVQLTSIRLWDGGAYENMGLEALYKPRTGLQGCDFLICSDASGPLKAPRSFFSALTGLFTGKLASPRLFDISSDQIRGLRSRMLVNSISRGEVKGILIRMGTSMRQLKVPSGKVATSLSDEQCLYALNYPTNLTRLTEEDFDLIAQHGEEVCGAMLDPSCC